MRDVETHADTRHACEGPMQLVPNDFGQTA